MDRRRFLKLAAGLSLTAGSNALASSSGFCSLPKPPVTPKRPKRIVQLGRVRVDDYAWLKQPDWQAVWRDPSKLSPNIKRYLMEENAYTDAVLAPTRSLQRGLVTEMSAHTDLDESAPPFPDGIWLYYSRFKPGAQHRSYFRKRRDGRGGEQLLLDGEERAQGRAYFNIVNATQSPNNNFFAWAEDDYGSEKFHIFIKDLKTGQILPDPVHDAYGGFVFSPDSHWLFWILRDENSRPSQVFRRPVRGNKDVSVYRQADPGFLMEISLTSSKSHIMIRIWNAETSEVRLVPGTAPTDVPRVVEPRTPGVVYSVEHWNGRFVILTNADGATDFKLMWADNSDPSRRTWRDWIPYRPGRFIIGMQPFRDYFVRVERIDANPKFFVTRLPAFHEYPITFDEPAYTASLDHDQDYASGTLRFVYQSPRQPNQWIAYDMADGREAVLKTQTAGPGFNKNNYVVERLFATAEDGAQVPITVLRRRDTPRDGNAPLLLYSYGSYGFSTEAGFSPANVSLVDRGWIYAIAHVRGGSEKGWSWFLAARRLHKKRTFSDFISCAEHLINQRYCRRQRIVIHGLSAGGLLVGAVTNSRPDLWAGVIAQAPFVDMLNTMSDASHPLVPLTRPDWGDPLADPAAYDYIASYSPYDNVTPQRYPPVLASTSVTDDRVGYWEPAKWIAKLRNCDLSTNPKMLRVDMEGGHGGAAGRYAELHQMALFYAFAIWAVTRNCSPQ